MAKIPGIGCGGDRPQASANRGGGKLSVTGATLSYLSLNAANVLWKRRKSARLKDSKMQMSMSVLLLTEEC
jgi:hypothetical protein